MIAGFVRGLSVRDVEATLVEALGEGAAVSKSTVSRVCEEIQAQFQAWSARRLDDVELDYLFLDGSHFKYHANASAEPVLAAWGIDTDGNLEVLVPQASHAQDVLGVARPAVARRHCDLHDALRADPRHHTRQRAAVPQSVCAHRRSSGRGCAPGGLRTAMMPTRERTRAQHRAERIAVERRHNQHARQARQRARDAVVFTGVSTHDEPPPF